MDDTIEDALEAETGLDWTVSQQGVAKYTAYCSPWKVVVEARNPKTDTTWTFHAEDESGTDESAIGPIDSDSIEGELKLFIRDFLEN